MIGTCRQAVGVKKVIGMRISGDEMDHEGLRADEVRAISAALDWDGVLDYFNIIAGSTHSTAGFVHVVPPMAVEAAYVVPLPRPSRPRSGGPCWWPGASTTPKRRSG